MAPVSSSIGEADFMSHGSRGDVVGAPPDQQQAADAATTRKAEPKRFVVRCRSMWRIRASPSLSAQTLGSVPHGTIIVGFLLDGASEDDPVDNWIRISHIEGEPPSQQAARKARYIYHRNSGGWGLYNLDDEGAGPALAGMGLGPEVGLLGTSLSGSGRQRRGAQGRRHTETAEDVSLTWKVLGHVDTLVDFFSNLSVRKEEGVSEKLCSKAEQRPQDIFVKKQKSQFKHAARDLKRAMCKLKDTATSLPGGASALIDVMPMDIRGRFVRLCEHLVGLKGATAPADVSTISRDALLTDCVMILGCLECSWDVPGLTNDLKKEMVAFSQQHSKDLQDHCRAVLRAGPPTGASLADPDQNTSEHKDEHVDSGVTEEPLIILEDDDVSFSGPPATKVAPLLPAPPQPGLALDVSLAL
eukprot:CAMPEP_0115645488 /NCGR_PEP_ID=MMETSP0272-20121206/38427_1 /TAXON_ID=71861 /ORGANISM="Scrippsiella trochoidea, Strain CCMP3099" /LENGTH=413 /DNA_ID=CAMNT_0003082959 /DNA_START=23 /DNA_END=1264 /DNA_ORIENTATION=+